MKESNEQIVQFILSGEPVVEERWAAKDAQNLRTMAKHFRDLADDLRNTCGSQAMFDQFFRPKNGSYGRADIFRAMANRCILLAEACEAVVLSKHIDRINMVLDPLTHEQRVTVMAEVSRQMRL